MFKVPKSTSDTGKVWPLEVGGQRGWCLCSAGRRPKWLFKIKLRKSPTVNIGLGQCHRVWRAKVTLMVSTTALPLVDPKQRAGVNERSTHTVHSNDHEECWHYFDIKIESTISVLLNPPPICTISSRNRGSVIYLHAYNARRIRMTDLGILANGFFITTRTLLFLIKLHFILNINEGT